MDQADDAFRMRMESRRRDAAQMTLGELLAAGQELRRRSMVIFEDMAVLEEQLRRTLSGPDRGGPE